MNWTDTIYSEVNSQFVSNPYPVFGETITVRIRFFKENPVEAVVLHAVMHGTSQRYSMREDRDGEGLFFTWYRVDIPVEAPRIQYSFELQTEEGFYFYSQRAVTRMHQTEDNDFVIIADFDNPAWVPGAVFYQIFPDRFRKGDSSCGVRAGEYSFDGGTAKALEWGTIPPEYDEGRCLDFFNGDLAGIREAIPYFKDLGVTALYINPIFQARTNHRYDCTDYFHVDEHLGGDEALADLMHALHNAGIRAVIDVSINHTGIDHPWFVRALEDPESREAGFYYRAEDNGSERAESGRYVYWFDVPTLPQLNYSSGELRELLWRSEDSMVCKFLKPPFSIDGWRFDVAPQVGRYRRDQYCHDIWREVRAAAKEKNDQAYLIGEHWEDHIRYVQGDQWDGAMNFFGSGRLLRLWAGERDRFLNDNWGHSPQPGRKISAEELAEALRTRISRIPNQLAYRAFNLLDCHDTPRFHNNEDVFDWEIYRGMIMLLFLLPGAVNYYYGDEVGLAGHVHSVEGARYAMEWNPEKQRAEFLHLYRTLGRLKSSEPALAEGGWKILYAAGEQLVFSRFLNETGFILVLNRQETAAEILIPAAAVGAVEAVDLFSGSKGAITGGILTAELQPRQSILYRCRLDEQLR